MSPFDLSDIKELLPSSLQLFLSFDLTSKNPLHRKLIREQVLSQLKQLSAQPEEKKILDLTQLPMDKSWSISISHCNNASGFALIDNSHNMGLDLESSERIKESLIHRIADPDEVHRTPEPSALFSAKESCWKAINNQIKVATISQIETHDWVKLPSKWFSFKATVNGQSLDGEGFLTEQSGIYISFFFSPSTFV